MRLKKAPNLTSSKVVQIIEEAQKAEIRQDTFALQNILSNLWKDYGKSPNYDEFADPLKAELLRLSGCFLTFYASSKNLKNYFLRAKDLLTIAIEIFESLNMSEKAAYAKANLGYTFGCNGENDEYALIYKSLERQFQNQVMHPLYLRIIVNRVAVHIFNRDFKKAEKYINKNRILFDFTENLILKALFHGNAAIVFRELGNLQESANQFNEAAKAAKNLEMITFEVKNLNNLALLYKDLIQFPKAYNCINKAINLARNMGDFGFLAHMLDSKALIFLAQSRYSKALEIIEEALEYFYQGEDYHGLTEALYTRFVCLIRLERETQAFICYGDLQRIAGEKIGETASEKFKRLFDNEILVLGGLSLVREKEALEKHLIRQALIRTSGKLGEAAELLELDNYQTLQYRLRVKFPDLKSELEIIQRKSPQRKIGSIPKPEKSRIIKVYKDEKTGFYQEKVITPIDLPSKIYSYKNFSEPPKNVETFYFNDAQMEIFGIREDSVIAVSPKSSIDIGMRVLLKVEGEFYIDKIKYDKDLHLYFIHDKDGQALPVDESNICGKVEGFCPYSKVHNGFVEFYKLED